MTLFMPPIQRKKKVAERYNPDSFRVISEDAQSDHPKYKPLPYRASFEPRTPTPKAFKAPGNEREDPLEPAFPAQPLKTTRVLPQILPDFRGNKPQTLSCGFLDRNVRFLNEPICHVYTKPLQSQEKNWWPSRANPGDLQVPPYVEATDYRCNFKLNEGERQAGSGRHTANSNRVPARGAVPVSCLGEKDGSKRLYKEGISYEHMYNCRSDPNYPIRGKRHGGFVWGRMDPISERKFAEYYKKLAEQEIKEQQQAAAHKMSSTESDINVSHQTKIESNSAPQPRQKTDSAKPQTSEESNNNKNCPVEKNEEKDKSDETSQDSSKSVVDNDEPSKTEN